MKIIIKLAIILASLFIIFPQGIYASSHLEIKYMGGALPSPLFNVTGMLPGDMDDKDVDVKNNGLVPSFIAIKGVKTGGVGDPPLLETVLEIVINDGSVDLYGGTLGTKTVQDFFNDSTDPNGIPLSAVAAGDTNTYNFKVTFPELAGNDFQEKSVIFDLTFGEIIGENVVINEVYYDVDAEHGLDSPKDRGILSIGSRNATVIISDNGAGSVNTAEVSINSLCKIVQSNNSGISNAVELYLNTGGNNASGNTGGNTGITSGNSNIFINIINNVFQSNFGSCNGRKLGQNHEWVELYNPTDETVNLRRWVLEDNSGQQVRLRGRLRPGQFALVSKDSSVWRFWDEDPGALKIRTGNHIGDGLDDDGDHLYLRNPDGDEVDAVGWQNDTVVWNPAVPDVAEGRSIERLAPGFDTNLPADWLDRFPPTPGI